MNTRTKLVLGVSGIVVTIFFISMYVLAGTAKVRTYAFADSLNDEAPVYVHPDAKITEAKAEGTNITVKTHVHIDQQSSSRQNSERVEQEILNGYCQSNVPEDITITFEVVDSQDEQVATVDVDPVTDC